MVSCPLEPHCSSTEVGLHEIRGLPCGEGIQSRPQHVTQARLLYVFEKDSHRPVFYRVLQGSIVDRSAFVDTVNAAGCRDCIIVADKGFYSKRNVSALLKAGMKYILPLREDTANVEPAFYEDADDGKWDDVFTYNRRAIWFRRRPSGGKGNYIYTFRDDSRRAELVGRFVESAE